MKKTFLTCLAVLALFAIAGSAGAITCTIDQRPAATLLVPYFSVSLNGDSTIQRGTPTSFDTLLSIGNASSAPMLAHVTVFNRRSILVLDFNVALTGFDVQSFRVSDIISGLLPSTPVSATHVPPDVSSDPSPDDACQRNPLSTVYPDPAGFLRVKPTCGTCLPATPADNSLATTAYPVPAFDPLGGFAQQTIDSLDDTDDSLECGDGSVDGVTSGPAIGYVTIDHANYCNLSNPSDPNYYFADAMGNENNLFGDIIFLSQAGVGTYGMAMVAIESDESFSGALQSDAVRTRTFYAPYWFPSLEVQCTNCGSGDPETDLLISSPWNTAYGDEREPLGLKWAGRYFEGSGVISYFDVWRNSLDLINDGDCDGIEPTVQLNFFDEDENGVSQIGPGPCPSPCEEPPPPTFNFPLEVNRRRANEFTLPAPLPGGPNVGWVSMDFNNILDGTNLDQAFVAYEFQGAGAFLSAHFPGWQLDPSACEPLGVTGVNPVTPVIPGGVDNELTPPAGIGP